MSSYLKNHPFEVETFFERSTVLTFSAPAEELQKLIPAPLQLDTFEGKGFVAIAMVDTKDLRPKGFPKFLGNNFFLIGYRVFVVYTSPNGKKYRGLYILKSETDKKLMEYVGNIFTHYNYITTDISIEQDERSKTILSHQSGFALNIAKNSAAELPKSSIFSDWKTAKKYSGPLPFTFTVNQKEKSILIIEGVRSNWKPQAIEVNQFDFSFLKNLEIEGLALASAFEVTKVPYYWKKGKLEQWQ